MRILIVDNYDSFTFNLYQAVAALGHEVWVARNDAINLDDVRAWRPDRIILSPGPGHPKDADRLGVCPEIIEHMSTTPVLGVCLGHQAIVHAFGGRVVRAERAVHGKTSQINNDGQRLFASLPRRFEAMRYHSLVADRASLPECLRVSAESAEGEIMAVEHRHRSIYGVQFHPESIGTELGPKLLDNFLSANA